jgi:acetylornithine deacetylase/succinyl-diaminopimelate desuccinylase-like protein
VSTITAATKTTYTYQWVPHVRAVAIDPVLALCIQEAARSLDLPFQDIDSGAGHDAQVLAAAAPVAMIFVPSAEGVSHSAQEYTSPKHLVAGAEVLAAALVEADVQLAVPHAAEETNGVA